MNNTDIDALSRRELDAAVAIAQGWRWMQPRMANGIALYHPDDIDDLDLIEPRTTKRLEGWDEGVPHYSTDIAAAWELDGDGWEWSFDETEWRDTLDVTLFYNQSKGNHIEVRVKFYDFPTKAAAYATARCRAALKAEYAERGE